MTIAIGIQCNEEIVICSDSQQTTGPVKDFDGKTRTSIFHGFSMIIVGAGDVDYIKTAREKIIEGLSDLTDLKEIETTLEANLLNFFDKHIAAWYLYPPDDRPSVELLIAISTKSGANRLYYYSGTAFYNTDKAAIGSGIIFANSLISEFYWNYSIEELSRAAAYILLKIKKSEIQCGGFTDLVAVRGNADFALSNSDEIKKAEDAFKAIEDESLKTLRRNITADRPSFLSWQSDHVAKKRRANNPTDLEN